MSADGSDFHCHAPAAQPAFLGLQGVTELVASPGLAILKESIDTAELKALMQLATLVAAHDADKPAR